MIDNKPIHISIEDIVKYHECRKRVFAGTCKKEGRTTCEGCEFDLSIAKIELINS